MYMRALSEIRQLVKPCAIDRFDTVQLGVEEIGADIGGWTWFAEFGRLRQLLSHDLDDIDSPVEAQPCPICALGRLFSPPIVFP